jgi:hypothetical protein
MYYTSIVSCEGTIHWKVETFWKTTSLLDENRRRKTLFALHWVWGGRGEVNRQNNNYLYSENLHTFKDLPLYILQVGGWCAAHAMSQNSCCWRNNFDFHVSAVTDTIFQVVYITEEKVGESIFLIHLKHRISSETVKVLKKTHYFLFK